MATQIETLEAIINDPNSSDVNKDLARQNLERLQAAKDEFIKAYGKDAVASDVLDVTDANSIKKTMQTACLQFGGLDIIVNNAGLSISKTIEDHTEQDWDILYARRYE
jgi:NADP-dependent 3-hydroxy acid dehydrogenase YdfG